MSLTLKLLGEFALRDAGGVTLSLPTRKTRALLGYLAANADRPQPRDRLMALLWSAFGEKQARHSLNQALLSIRKLGLPLDSDGERVTLPGGAVDIDLARFRAYLDSDPAATAKLYDGPFLDGLAVPDPAFEDWLATIRAELHDRACDALARAADASDAANATEFTRRLITLDPLREDAHRRLMRLLHDTGDRAGALRQYQACAEILKKELQVEPDAQTKDLFEAIRSETGASAIDAVSSRAPEAPPADTPPLLPDIPSIAVLPFVNLSGDHHQDYLAEGIRLDIQTTLVRIPRLFLIATGPVNIYRGRDVAAEQVACELGIRYVLEGAVQKSNERIRVTVQLTDTVAQKVIWAERYDSVADDNFTVQDEITAEVLTALDVKLLSGERNRARSTLKNLEARDFFYRGLNHFYATTNEDNLIALELFEKVAELQPDSPVGPTYLCMTYSRDVFRYPPQDENQSLAKALGWAEKAVEIGDTNGLPHLVLAADLILNRRHAEALAKTSEAFDLRPNCPIANASQASMLLYCGKPDEAIARIKMAMRIAQAYPPWFANVLAAAYRENGETGNSISTARQMVQHSPDDVEARINLCSCFVHADLPKEARNAAREILAIDPSFSVNKYIESQPFEDEAILERLTGGLREAGLPE